MNKKSGLTASTLQDLSYCLIQLTWAYEINLSKLSPVITECYTCLSIMYKILFPRARYWYVSYHIKDYKYYIVFGHLMASENILLGSQYYL
jgi:hypothetical protein